MELRQLWAHELRGWCILSEAAVYYLNWDREQEEHGDATERFHRLHGQNSSTSLSKHEFERLYREVIAVEANDPEQVWRGWNRGSGRESEEFLDLRHCDQCQTYIEGSDEAVTHAVQNHGYDVNASGEPDYVRGERSMSVGDIVEIDGKYYMAAAVGWKEIEIGGGA